LAKLERPEIGWLGELAVDEALVVRSGGRLIPWIPLVDSHGVDRGFSWDGVGAPDFVQVKTSGFADDEGRHRWDLRVGSFAAYHGLSIVLALFDPKSKRIGDVFWRLDSTLLRRLARREYDSALRTEVYRLDGSPSHQDRLAPYRHSRDALWKEFAPPRATAAASPGRLPDLRIDQGGIDTTPPAGAGIVVGDKEVGALTTVARSEGGVVALGNHKDLLLFRPAFDIKGRDLLVQRVGSPMALFAQVKGTAVVRGHDLVRFHVRRNTFVPAEDFWLALYCWVHRPAGLFPECWLIPSIALAQGTAHQRDSSYLTIDARLDATVDRWAVWRCPIHEQADVFRAGLHRLRAAA